jgi:hypothetical protein
MKVHMYILDGASTMVSNANAWISDEGREGKGPDSENSREGKVKPCLKVA